jgi:hypothetical protein
MEKNVINLLGNSINPYDSAAGHRNQITIPAYCV